MKKISEIFFAVRPLIVFGVPLLITWTLGNYITHGHKIYDQIVPIEKSLTDNVVNVSAPSEGNRPPTSIIPGENFTIVKYPETEKIFDTNFEQVDYLRLLGTPDSVINRIKDKTLKFCFSMSTQYMSLSGPHAHSTDHMKVEITKENGEKIKLHANDSRCMDLTELSGWYIAETQINLEKSVTDIIEYGQKNKLKSVIKISFTIKPNVTIGDLILLMLFIFPGAWTAIFSAIQLHKFVFSDMYRKNFY